MTWAGRVLAGGLVAAVSAGCAGGAGGSGGGASDGGVHVTPGVAVPAVQVLASVEVAEAGHTATYERDAFGSGWATRDGCSTRSSALIEESTVKVRLRGVCTVVRGEWESWYDGTTWDDPADVDVDHLVPLAEAWRSGAWAWDDARRRAYANYLGWPDHLVAVTDELNQVKGDEDPATWLPDEQRCRYAQDWVVVKAAWGLTMDDAEHDALAALLTGTCGEQEVTVPDVDG